jgi:hypothetical protein
MTCALLQDLVERLANRYCRCSGRLVASEALDFVAGATRAKLEVAWELAGGLLTDLLEDTASNKRFRGE